MLTLQVVRDQKLASVRVMSLDPAQPGALRYQGDQGLVQVLKTTMEKVSPEDWPRMFGSPAQISDLVRFNGLDPFHPAIVEFCEGCVGFCQDGNCPKK